MPRTPAHSSGPVGPQEAMNPLGTPYPISGQHGWGMIIFSSCCLPRPYGDLASWLPRSPPCVLQGTWQEGRNPAPSLRPYSPSWREMDS